MGRDLLDMHLKATRIAVEMLLKRARQALPNDFHRPLGIGFVVLREHDAGDASSLYASRCPSSSANAHPPQSQRPASGGSARDNESMVNMSGARLHWQRLRQRGG